MERELVEALKVLKGLRTTEYLENSKVRKHPAECIVDNENLIQPLNGYEPWHHPHTYSVWPTVKSQPFRPTPL